MVDRRGFLQGAGALAGMAALGSRGWGAPGRFAYAVSSGDRVHVFADRGGGWGLVQTVRSAAPAGVAVSPDGRFVYVGNGVGEFEGLPSGAVEVFSVGERGWLTPVGRRGLALFATAPERLAVSPKGRWLAVRLAGGGYNLLPVGEDGLPGRVVASLRRIGREEGAGALVFAEDGLLVSGCADTVTALSVGVDGSLGFLEDWGGGSSGLVSDGFGVDAGLLRAMRLVGARLL